MGQWKLSKRFIAAYNEVDRYLRANAAVNNSVSHTELIRKSKNPYINNNSEKLKQFADLRNAIVHNPRQEADPIAEPHEFIVREYEKICAMLVTPPLALEKMAVKGADIFTATLDTSVLCVMNQMYEKDFTNIPVLDGGTLFGVFSENSLFSYIVKAKEILLTDKEKLREFKEFLPLGNHLSERYEFISRTSTVYDIQNLFQQEIQNNKRIAAAFITHNGKKSEKILGMITPWDVASYSYD